MERKETIAKTGIVKVMRIILRYGQLGQSLFLKAVTYVEDVLLLLRGIGVMRRMHHDEEAGQEAREAHHGSGNDFCQLLECEVTDEGNNHWKRISQSAAGIGLKDSLQGPDSFGTGQVWFTWEWSSLWNNSRDASIAKDISCDD